jgi:hypothetical protein
MHVTGQLGLAVPGRSSHLYCGTKVGEPQGEYNMAKQSGWCSFSIWLRGLIAAFVGGGSGSVTTGLASMGIDPEHFNLNSGLHHILDLMAAVFLINGLVSACLFLKQSPIPAAHGEMSPVTR